MKKTIAASLSGLAIAGLLLPTAASAGIGEELTIAQTHSLLAFRSGGRGVGGAKTHLQHVLNCLVGPGGEGYNATPPMMDPCANITSYGSEEQKKHWLPKMIAGEVITAIAMTKKAIEINEPEPMQTATTDLADAILAAKE